MMRDAEIERLLVQFREQYGVVYVTSIGEDEFVYRPLTRQEYMNIAEFSTNEDDAFERICNTAVLWPKIDFRYAKAYWPTMLAPQILEMSGFDGTYKELEWLEHYRRQVQMSFERQAEIMVATAFPQYKIEEIRTWTREKLIEFAVMAEWQFQEIRGLRHMSLARVDQLPTQTEENGEEAENQEPEKSLKEKAWELRKQGIDPAVVFADLVHKPKPPFFERPVVGGVEQVDSMIAGIDAWRGGVPRGRYELVQKQVQDVSRRRR